MDDHGFILIESSIALVICSYALFTFLLLFVIVIKANQKIGRVAAATQLTSSLMEEIRLRRWDQATPIPARAITKGGPLGPENGEADKLSFNDVDDFNDWTESPPVGPMMQPLPSFKTFTRKVEVEYVDANFAPSTVPTDYKHVRVCAWDPGMNPVCLDTLFTNR
jgi:hypothetical protein